MAGMVAGDRLEYLASGSVEELRSRLEGMAGFDALLDTDRLGMRSLEDLYDTDAVVDPHTPVAAYAAVTRDALADGYAGLRVVAEATALVRTAAQRDAFGRYKHLVDRYMVDHPFAAMCGYDARELGPAVASEIACLHPQVSPGATAFRWHAGPDADVELIGEVDITCHDVFDVTVARTLPLMGRPRVVVDARGLGFIDHRGMLTLERRARDLGAEISLLTDAPVVHRLAGLLDLEALRPEPAC